MRVAGLFGFRNDKCAPAEQQSVRASESSDLPVLYYVRLVLRLAYIGLLLLLTFRLTGV